MQPNQIDEILSRAPEVPEFRESRKINAFILGVAVGAALVLILVTLMGGPRKCF